MSRARRSTFQPQALMSVHSANSSTTTTSSPSTTSTFSAPTPTYTPLIDCPASNNTTYTSSYASASSSNNASLTFTKFCDLSSPLTTHNLAEAFVYSFSDCIELCAGFNVLNSGSNCTAAVYQPTGSRPSNCWVGSAASGVQASSLKGQTGQDVALLPL